jgi:uncharacterized protein Yka (UPF0111/DUF47 family)
MTAGRRHWFLPETPRVLDMLCAQADATVEGMHALAAWADGDSAAADEVRSAEHRADERKRDLRRALTVAFTTPIDAEDLYTMSERLDAVLNGAKDAVREAEVMSLEPDRPLAEMSGLLATGVDHLAGAFRSLRMSPKERGEAATDAADLAVKSQRRLERVYRSAMSALVQESDLRMVMGRRELYRRFSRISEVLVETADRIWYALIKEG